MFLRDFSGQHNDQVNRPIGASAGETITGPIYTKKGVVAVWGIEPRNLPILVRQEPHLVRGHTTIKVIEVGENVNLY